MILGILLGLTVLARIDGVLLILVMLLDYLVLLRAKGISAKRLGRLSLVPLGVLHLYGPWLLFNMAVCGSPLQDSGAATRFLSLAYAGYFGYGMGSMASRGPDSSFIWAHLTHAISTMKVIPPMHLIFRLIDRAGAMLGSPGGFHSAGNIIGFLALGGMGFAALGWRRDERKKRRGEVHFLVLFAAVLCRFLCDIRLRHVLLSPLLLSRLSDRVHLPRLLFARHPRVVRPAAGCDEARRDPGLRGFMSGFSAVFSYSQAFRSRPIYPFYDVSRWVNENTGVAERIGVFQCGTIGYLSKRQIINLDGKVNRGALEAMKSGCLDGYLRKEGIEVVIDHSDILRIFFGDARGKMPGSCTDIVCREMKSPSGWIAYRWPAGTLAKGPAGAGSAGGGSIRIAR